MNKDCNSIMILEKNVASVFTADENLFRLEKEGAFFQRQFHSSQFPEIISLNQERISGV